MYRNFHGSGAATDRATARGQKLAEEISGASAHALGQHEFDSIVM
jgi:hypothetical protein